eukprot:4905087-Amphidinium_carterae.1
MLRFPEFGSFVACNVLQSFDHPPYVVDSHEHVIVIAIVMYDIGDHFSVGAVVTINAFALRVVAADAVAVII